MAALSIAFSTAYWALLAADRYESEARVVLARSDLSGGQAMDFATLFGGSANNRTDQLLLRDHLRSLDMLRQLNGALGLRAHYSGNGDLLSRLWDAQAPIEHLHRHFLRRVSVEMDEFAGVLVIRAQAYTPQMAQAITAALLAEGERHMNALGHQLAQDQVRFLERQVHELGERAAATRATLLAFQNREGMASPQAAADSIAAIVARLETQLAELQTRRGGMATFLQPGASQLVEVNAQIAAVEQQIRRERERLTSPQGGTLNAALSEYQRLQADAEFANQVLNTALVSLERGRVDATRTLKQVQVLQSAGLPEYPDRPHRLFNAIAYALGTLLIAGVLQLLLTIVRDHQD
jgi:capsular polysaccharide transport system permease protein